MSGVIRNAASAAARSIGSENGITMSGVVFWPLPRGAEVTTAGGVVSTRVHVSLPAGPGSTFPARSVARDRNANSCPSAPRGKEADGERRTADAGAGHGGRDTVDDVQTGSGDSTRPNAHHQPVRPRFVDLHLVVAGG